MITELDWEKIYAEGHPDPVESGWPQEAPEAFYHPPSGSGAQKAAGWHRRVATPCPLDSLIHTHTAVYPDNQRRAWVERRLRAWWAGRNV